MKRLFDQNLSPGLVSSLASLYPGSIHVRDVAMAGAPDQVVWRYAGKNGFAIASKDPDFQHLSFVYGHPPKVVWIRLGSLTTQQVDEVLRRRHRDLLAFDQDPNASYLVVS